MKRRGSVRRVASLGCPGKRARKAWQRPRDHLTQLSESSRSPKMVCPTPWHVMLGPYVTALRDPVEPQSALMRMACVVPMKRTSRTVMLTSAPVPAPRDPMLVPWPVPK